MAAKDQIRRMALERRDLLDAADRARWSLEIQDRIRRSAMYRDAGVVLSYASFRSEVITDRINEWILEDGKCLCLPRTYAGLHEMVYYQVHDMDSLVPGYQGIREPEEDEPWTPRSTESVLMLMPGAAFDGHGIRIGYGGGYYDRYLQRYGAGIANTVMLAFSVQQVPQIPCGVYDIPPDYIVTEELPGQGI